MDTVAKQRVGLMQYLLRPIAKDGEELLVDVHERTLGEIIGIDNVGHGLGHAVA